MIKPRFWARSGVASIPRRRRSAPRRCHGERVGPLQKRRHSVRQYLLAHKKSHLHWRRRPNGLAPHRAAETVRASPEPHSVGGIQPRVAGCAEGRPEPTNWRLDTIIGVMDIVGGLDMRSDVKKVHKIRSTAGA
jgi:hypothetical protein